MKRVILLRHASANNQKFNQKIDHEKPLDALGENDCKNLSSWLKKSHIDIDLVITSDAKRAEQTSELVFSPCKVTVEKNANFYLCNYEEILYSLKTLNKEINNVAIVGHEPSISDTLRALVGAIRPDLEKGLHSLYLPCTISFIFFNIKSWNDLNEKEGLLEGYLSPETLRKKNEKN